MSILCTSLRLRASAERHPPGLFALGVTWFRGALAHQGSVNVGWWALHLTYYTTPTETTR